LFSLDQLIEAFDIDRIHKSGARFDYDKALWFNHQYIQQLDFSSAKERLIQYANADKIKIDNIDLEAVYKLLQPRLHRLKEFFSQGDYFFHRQASL
jgi:glutamyl-tRNA synthetase